MGIEKAVLLAFWTVDCSALMMVGYLVVQMDHSSEVVLGYGLVAP